MLSMLALLEVACPLALDVSISRLYVCNIRSLSLDKNGLISVHLGRKDTTTTFLENGSVVFGNETL